MERVEANLYCESITLNYRYFKLIYIYHVHKIFHFQCLSSAPNKFTACLQDLTSGLVDRFLNNKMLAYAQS